MTDLRPDSFTVSSIGHQANKQTMPSYSVGTGTRDTAALKTFHSKKLEKSKAIVNSPGPVYQVPSSVGGGPSFGFGVDQQRVHPSAKYPDSSVDLTCATVDSQKFKYHNTPGVHFGTEPKMSSKNGEIVRTHPTSVLGQESPGALEYHPQEEQLYKRTPAYSFGPAEDRAPRKPESRITLVPGSSPRQTGPGSHQVPSGVGRQPHSARPSAPSWSFGGGSSPRQPATAREPGLKIEDKLFSSLGKQVLSKLPSSPTRAFGKSTRDQVGKTAICMTDMDKTAAAKMPRPQLNLELPKATFVKPCVGM
eukprot:TRINITY_DN31673_c0_g1_i1.p1 TRINITY_DN31673_c0_g1~~TRINITY_DN31673_c0_g1_i1.p1  ORF type:complete len:306 (-),score=33.67 TRINITY_DN31673_c0_g1_i1:133-1050(-)